MKFALAALATVTFSFVIAAFSIAGKTNSRSPWQRAFLEFCGAASKFGLIWLALFSFGNQWPPVQEQALIFAAALLALGLFVPSKAYRVAAICLMTFALFQAFHAHKKAAPIREKLQKIGLNAVP